MVKLNALLLLTIIVHAVLSKVSYQRHKFYKDDFFYSSKFGSPANSQLTVSFKAKIINWVKVESGE